MIKDFDGFISIIENKKRDHIIFCDLDGVLVDLEKGFTDIPANTERLTMKEYEAKHGKNSIWGIIDKMGETFWADLPWTKDGRELWDYLKRYNPIILSAPSQSKACVFGKISWVKRNLNIDEEPVRKPDNFKRDTKFVLYNNKSAFVAPAKNIFQCDIILIDDYKEKLNKWTAAGGTGILHNDSTDTIRVLEEIMTT